MASDELEDDQRPWSRPLSSRWRDGGPILAMRRSPPIKRRPRATAGGEAVRTLGRIFRGTGGRSLAFGLHDLLPCPRVPTYSPQKVAERLFAKYIRIALAIFGKFDDSFGYAVVGVKTAPVSLNSRASHFECNAHDPRRFRIKLYRQEMG